MQCFHSTLLGGTPSVFIAAVNTLYGSKDGYCTNLVVRVEHTEVTHSQDQLLQQSAVLVLGAVPVCVCPMLYVLHVHIRVCTWRDGRQREKERGR